MNFQLRWLPVLLFCCVISIPAWAQTPPSPPFKQCAPVGGNTSCRILIYIDKDEGLRVLTDTNAALTYDGNDDTLIGVLNQSSKTITSIPLHASGPIFGFDDDGICGDDPNTGKPFNPRPVGCPFGPTGYEGPGVKFSSISTDKTSGIVNFNLRPDEFAYFGLEDAIQTMCPTTIVPVRLLQCDASTWPGSGKSTDLIGNSQATICSYGCYLTSAAMLINYHAAKQGEAFRTNPALLNQYLTANKGFDASGNVIDQAMIAKYARVNNVDLFYAGVVTHRVSKTAILGPNSLTGFWIQDVKAVSLMPGGPALSGK